MANFDDIYRAVLARERPPARDNDGVLSFDLATHPRIQPAAAAIFNRCKGRLIEGVPWRTQVFAPFIGFRMRQVLARLGWDEDKNFTGLYYRFFDNEDEHANTAG